MSWQNCDDKDGLLRYIGAKGVSKALCEDELQEPPGCLWAAIEKMANDGIVNIENDFARIAS